MTKAMVIVEHSLVQTLKALNLPYSENEILKIKEDLKNELEFPKQRELTCKCFCSHHRWLFKSEVKVIVKANLLLAMPASVSTKKGKKDIFGIYTFFGKENKANWMKVFDDLITRGLKEVLIVISDDFPGIIDAVKIACSCADLELAFVHLQQNSRKHMTKDKAFRF